MEHRTKSPPLPDGIHKHLSWSEYVASDRINPSALKVGKKSMKHFEHGLHNPRPDTPAMRLGRAMHMAILERERFNDEVAVWPGVRRGKDWTAFKEDHGHCEIITAAEHENMIGMAKAVEVDPIAVSVIQGMFPEATVCSTEPVLGLECKGRMDLYKPGLIADIKTTQDIDPHQFGRTFNNFGYHISLGLYRRWVYQQTGDKCQVKIIAVESSAPYDVAVIHVPTDVLEHGEALGVALLTQVAECQKAQHWPGVANGEELVLDFPEWALPEPILKGFSDED